MNPVFKRVLDNLRRANATAKQKMAENYGFKTVAEFEQYLNAYLNIEPAANPNPPAPNPTTRKKKQKVIVGTPPLLHNVHILDASMSMKDGNKIGRALEGINTEIKELKVNPDVLYITNTLVHFSGSGDIQNDCWKLKMTEAKDNFSCSPRGWTALYEAMGVTLERLLAEHKTGEKVLIKIFTDGEENGSAKKWKTNHFPSLPSEDLKLLIQKCKENGFVITFVGTQVDVNRIVKDLPIDKSNTLVHDNTAAGVTKSFKKSIGATVAYRAASTRGTDTLENFFVDTND